MPVGFILALRFGTHALAPSVLPGLATGVCALVTLAVLAQSVPLLPSDTAGVVSPACDSSLPCTSCNWWVWLRGRESCGTTGWHRPCPSTQTDWDSCLPEPVARGPGLLSTVLIAVISVSGALVTWCLLQRALAIQARQTSASLRQLLRCD